MYAQSWPVLDISTTLRTPVTVEASSGRLWHAVIGTLATTVAAGGIIAFGQKRQHALMMQDFEEQRSKAAEPPSAASAAPAATQRTRVKQPEPVNKGPGMIGDESK